MAMFELLSESKLILRFWSGTEVTVSSAIGTQTPLSGDLSLVPEPGYGRRGHKLVCEAYKEHPEDNMGATMFNGSVNPWSRIRNCRQVRAGLSHGVAVFTVRQHYQHMLKRFH